MKKSLICLLVLLCGLSCEQEDNNIFEDLTVRGGFIAFEDEEPNSLFNLLELENFNMEAVLIDPNNNATRYSLAVEYEGVEVTDIFVATSFPANLEITLQSLLDAFGITEADLTTASIFNFNATITTPTGVFTATPIDFNDATNEQLGGNTFTELLQSGYNHAFFFNATFFLPPPAKIRGTSFEEPDAGSGNYVRNGGPLEEVELLNNPGQPNIMYTAEGTGEDDEIGFKAEFVDIGTGDGFTSERIGTSAFLTDVGSFLDGDQGYRLQDADGQIKLTFDTVTIPSTIPLSGARIQFYIPDVGNNMESSDRLTVYVMLEKAGGVMETLQLFDEDGVALNDMRDSWTLIDSGLLENVISHTLVVEHNTNSNDERIYFDEMLIYKPEE